jgi:hypothetical protein
MRSKSNESVRADQTPPYELRPSDDEIALRAYDLYRRRGATDGQDQDDWLRAEAELIDERRRHLAII